LFTGLNTQVLGISVDTVPCLVAWANSLGGINYPLLSDFWPHGEVARCYDVLRKDGFTERAIFVIDRDGILRHAEVLDIARIPDNEALREIIRKIDPVAATLEPRIQPEDEPLPHGGIVMYCTPWCGDCKRARAWLAQKGLVYTEVDISRSAKAAAQVRAWANGNQTTPTFDIDGQIIVDFDAAKLEQVLAR
jgi:glutaredoxin